MIIWLCEKSSLIGLELSLSSMPIRLERDASKHLLDFCQVSFYYKSQETQKSALRFLPVPYPFQATATGQTGFAAVQSSLGKGLCVAFQF